ncbi:hypothetical protein CEXT_677501 [Caerostris extrusa]|uniref:Uncharacterized protein n=1 Tax=Caerostris extrusa TaxID=172846 RepID=A0AAV4N1Z8_CAEEX|nr:hypothetical protein CEXT_677501 [Caerostris extrusa]
MTIMIKIREACNKMGRMMEGERWSLPLTNKLLLKFVSKELMHSRKLFTEAKLFRNEYVICLETFLLSLVLETFKRILPILQVGALGGFTGHLQYICIQMKIVDQKSCRPDMRSCIHYIPKMFTSSVYAGGQAVEVAQRSCW